MEGQWIECRECGALPSEMQGYAAKTCSLCGALHCDECLNEAGYCTPCSEESLWSKEEGIAV